MVWTRYRLRCPGGKAGVPTGEGRGEPAGGRRAIGEERRGDARQVKQNSDFRPPIGFPNMITHTQQRSFSFLSQSVLWLHSAAGSCIADPDRVVAAVAVGEEPPSLVMRAGLLHARVHAHGQGPGWTARLG
eukprot:SAG25_NODE_343_length_9443_cov_3.590218_4_plen_131_part_00